MTRPESERSAKEEVEGRRPGRFAVAAAGAVAVAAGLAYASWGLFQSPVDESSPIAESAGASVDLDRAPALSPAPQEPIPTARLTLDEGTETAAQPVVNAHLEVSGGNENSASLIEIAPAVRQLGFSPEPTATRPAGSVGAWLTGTIEPLPEPADAAPSPFVRRSGPAN